MAKVIKSFQKLLGIIKPIKSKTFGFVSHRYVSVYREETKNFRKKFQKFSKQSKTVIFVIIRYMNDATHLTPQAIKQEQEKLQREYMERVKDKEVDIVLDAKRPEIKVPVTVAVRKNVQVSDLPAVWLFAFGNLSVEEYNKYLEENKKSLTINELTASKVLEGVLRGDKEDKQIYWRLQERILSKPNAVGQKSNLSDLKPNAIMSQLLDEIEANVFKEAKEGQVIDGEPDEQESK